MKDEVYEKLFKLSHKTEYNLVTPLLLDYFKLEKEGFKDEEITIILENRINLEKYLKSD
jgi:hypothetical protein